MFTCQTAVLVGAALSGRGAVMSSAPKKEESVQERLPQSLACNYSIMPYTAVSPVEKQEQSAACMRG